MLRTFVAAIVFVALGVSSLWADDPSALWAKGDAYLVSGRPEIAVGCYRRAIASGGDIREQHHARNFGHALLASAPPAYAEAIEVLHTALAVDPSDDLARKFLATAMLATGATVDAIREYEALVAAHPHDSEYTLALANAVTQSGERDRALAIMERALDQHADWRNVRLEYARLLNFTRHFPEARKQFEIVLQSDASNLIAQVGLAKATSWSGDQETALAMYDRLLAQHPSLYDALVGKAFALLWMGRRSEATVLLRDAVRRHPDDHDVREALAEIPGEVSVRKPETPADSASAPKIQPSKNAVRRRQDTVQDPGVAAPSVIPRSATQPPETGHDRGQGTPVRSSHLAVGGTIFVGLFVLVSVRARLRARRMTREREQRSALPAMARVREAPIGMTWQTGADSSLGVASATPMEEATIGSDPRHHSEAPDASGEKAESKARPLVLMVGSKHQSRPGTSSMYTRSAEVVTLHDWPAAIAFALHSQPEIIVLDSATNDGWDVVRMMTWLEKNAPDLAQRTVVSELANCH